MNVQYAHQGRRHLRAGGQPARLPHRALRRQGRSASPIAKIAAAHHGRREPGELRPSSRKQLDHIAVKEAVFPFARFPGVDTLLGPEMRSTGEVMGLDRTFGSPSPRASSAPAPTCRATGTVFVSVRDDDKPRILDRCATLADSASRSSPPSARSAILAEQRRPRRQDQQGAGGPPAHRRRHQERRGPARLQHHRGPAGALADSRSLRRAALMHKVPYYTTLAGAVAAAEGIKAYRAAISKSARCRPISRPDA